MMLQQILCASVALKGLLLWTQTPDWATQGKAFSAYWLDKWLFTKCPLIRYKHLELRHSPLVYLTCKQNEKIHLFVIALQNNPYECFLIWCPYQQDVCICQFPSSPLQMIITKWFMWLLCDLPNAAVKVRLGLGTKNYFINLRKWLWFWLKEGRLEDDCVHC